MWIGYLHRIRLAYAFIMLCNSNIAFANRYKGPVFTDPLRRALDRGSEGLDLINSPLVLDYVHVKFTGTLPSWTSRNPFQPTINEGILVSFLNYHVRRVSGGVRGTFQVLYLSTD